MFKNCVFKPSLYDKVSKKYLYNEGTGNLAQL